MIALALFALYCVMAGATYILTVHLGYLENTYSKSDRAAGRFFTALFWPISLFVIAGAVGSKWLINKYLP